MEPGRAQDADLAAASGAHRAGVVYVSTNARTAMTPFLAVRRASDHADVDRDGLASPS